VLLGRQTSVPCRATAIPYTVEKYIRFADVRLVLCTFGGLACAGCRAGDKTSRRITAFPTGAALRCDGGRRPACPTRFTACFAPPNASVRPVIPMNPPYPAALSRKRGGKVPILRPLPNPPGTPRLWPRFAALSRLYKTARFAVSRTG
jgi:hypothetical protein